MPRGERGTSRPYKRGRIWWIRYTVPGETDERFESSKSTNKNDAVKLLNQRRSEVDNRQISSGNATIADLLELYLADQRKQKRSAYKSAEGYVRIHLSPAFGKLKASEITSSQINRFIEMKQQQGFADASINLYLAALRRGFTLAVEALPPLVTASVVPNFEELMLELNNVREGFLEHYQYENLRNELPDHQRLVLVIGYHLGMRRGEILKLRWDQVDWDANLIRLEKKQTKGKKARVAPLYGELRGWLEMAHAVRLPECPFIISWQGQGISQIKTAWNKARVRAGIPEILVHDLRRTAARNMTRAGISEKRAMLIAGWKTANIFKRYDITDERDIQEDGRRLANHLAEKAKLAKERRQLEQEKAKVRTKSVQSGERPDPADLVN